MPELHLRSSSSLPGSVVIIIVSRESFEAESFEAESFEAESFEKVRVEKESLKRKG